MDFITFVISNSLCGSVFFKNNNRVKEQNRQDMKEESV